MADNMQQSRPASCSLFIEEKDRGAAEKHEPKTGESEKLSNKVEKFPPEKKARSSMKITNVLEERRNESKEMKNNFNTKIYGPSHGKNNEGGEMTPKLNLKMPAHSEPKGLKMPAHSEPKGSFKIGQNMKNGVVEVKGNLKSISELSGKKSHSESNDPTMKGHIKSTDPTKKVHIGHSESSDPANAKPSWEAKPNQRPQRERSFVKPQARNNPRKSSGNIRREATFVSLNDSYKVPPGNCGDYRGKKHSQFANKEKNSLRGSQSSDQVIRDPNRRSSADVASNHSDSPPAANNNNRGSGSWRGKPSRELYRPPFPSDNLPEPQSPQTAPASLSYPLNPAAKEFKPPSFHPHHNHRESREILTTGEDMFEEGVSGRVGLTITVKGAQPLRKSKSLSNTSNLAYPELSELGNFPMDVQLNINKALEDPNRLSGRSVMDLVRQIFGRVVEGSRFAEPAARLCISIIERETRETFLESLLNTCQEWYHDRERLLRQGSDWPATRWPAFITFLNEMYGLLKRKQLHLMTKYEGIPPKLVLLSLLAECCTATLNSPSLASVNETECLFIILTSVGRDLEQETPGRMSNLVACLRNAFLTSPATSQIRKTLLQLVELQAAGWQLPAQAVMYYYPGANM